MATWWWLSCMDKWDDEFKGAAIGIRMKLNGKRYGSVLEIPLLES